ncbi:hypothetical protein [Actinomadura rudentiformis]|uniref:hypothetical protein n=1 Tax=Actinomadura rudentiformis TaxID=359158 RepID=UPI00178C2E99|nr:hypothetical protein [Actinomadura rudentiformis]
MSSGLFLFCGDIGQVADHGRRPVKLGLDFWSRASAELGGIPLKVGSIFSGIAMRDL